MSDYLDYLESDWWQSVRLRELARAGRCCEFCGTDEGEMNVHHLDYDNVGVEDSEDLIVLCRSCHQDAHDFPKIGEQIRGFAARRSL